MHLPACATASDDEIFENYSGVEIDEFVIMPNHIHGIVVLVGATPCGRPDTLECTNSGQAQGPAPTLTLSDVVHRFKTLTTKRYTDGVKHNGWHPFPRKLWQRNYYEHIICNKMAGNVCSAKSWMGKWC